MAGTYRQASSTRYEPLLRCERINNAEQLTKDDEKHETGAQNGDSKGSIDAKDREIENKKASGHVHFSKTIESSPNRKKSSRKSSSRTHPEYLDGLTNVCMQLFIAFKIVFAL